MKTLWVFVTSEEEEMDAKKDRNAGKFAEPRSWAARWCGHGLNTPGPRPQRVEPNEKRFIKPRGWSAKWCGGGLGVDPRARR